MIQVAPILVCPVLFLDKDTNALLLEYSMTFLKLVLPRFGFPEPNTNEFRAKIILSDNFLKKAIHPTLELILNRSAFDSFLIDIVSFPFVLEFISFSHLISEDVYNAKLPLVKSPLDPSFFSDAYTNLFSI